MFYCHLDRQNTRRMFYDHRDRRHKILFNCFIVTEIVKILGESPQAPDRVPGQQVDLLRLPHPPGFPQLLIKIKLKTIKTQQKTTKPPRSPSPT